MIATYSDQLASILALVRKAYAVTGVRPNRSCYLDISRNCGCAVGAVHHAFRTRRVREDERDTFSRLTGMPVYQVGDFERGFDSAFKPRPLYEDYAKTQSIPWRLGRDVGLSVLPREFQSSKEQS